MVIIVIIRENTVVAHSASRIIIIGQGLLGDLIIILSPGNASGGDDINSYMAEGKSKIVFLAQRGSS